MKTLKSDRRVRHEAGMEEMNALFLFNPKEKRAPAAKHSRPKARRVARKAARAARKEQR